MEPISDKEDNEESAKKSDSGNDGSPVDEEKNRADEGV
jgi:hypothetical protein